MRDPCHFSNMAQICAVSHWTDQLASLTARIGETGARSPILPVVFHLLLDITASSMTLNGSGGGQSLWCLQQSSCQTEGKWKNYKWLSSNCFWPNLEVSGDTWIVCASQMKDRQLRGGLQWPLDQLAPVDQLTAYSPEYHQLPTEDRAVDGY